MTNLKTADDAVSALTAAPAASAAAEERRGLLEAWNQTRGDYPRHKCVHQLFEEQAERSPAAVAVVFADQRLTYRELNERANQLAHHLRARKVGPNVLVGIHASRSHEFVVAVLGILKAGGAYLPLDPAYPVERLGFMMADAELTVLVGSGPEQIGFEPGNREVVHLEHDAPAIFCQSATGPSGGNTPQDAAYVLYTSGSTGQPKGVRMPHEPLVNLIHWQNQHSQCGPGERTLQFAPFGFDVCFQEIFSTLCAGGTLVVASEEERNDFISLVRLIEQQEINRLFLPFMALELLAMVAAETGRRPRSLREIITAGEQLRITPAIRSFFESLSNARLINQYGPTEAHVVSVFALEGNPADWPFLPPIGRPISNARLYVLDPHLDPVPIGAPGELYIGGIPVAKGYLKRPELTRQRFISDPFDPTPGARLYGTGDQARRLPDGNLEFLGRADDQVKIRGFRIEPGEIEALLASHPDVQSAVVMAREDAPGSKYLAAYIVGRNELPPLIPRLREFLRRKLPDYMVPAAFSLLPELPLTRNGKIDRQALPAPRFDDAVPAAGYLAPAAPGEQAMAAVWSELLGMPNIGIHDNFFELGGNSLMAMQLLLKAKKMTGYWIEPSTFRLQPTVSGLCGAVQARRLGQGFQPVLMIRKPGTRPPLFCLYGISGDVEEYFDLAAALGEDQPVIGIRSLSLADPSRLPQTLEMAAEEVIGVIRSVMPRGVPALAGYSWSGLLAFEVARQLAVKEGIGCFAALVGPDAPLRPTTFAFRCAHFVRNLFPWLMGLIQDRQNKHWRHLDRWGGLFKATGQNLLAAPQTVPAWVSSPVSRHLVALHEKYRPPVGSEVAIDLFRERISFQPQAHPLIAWETNHLADAGWSYWTRQPARVHWLEGDHLTILKPPVVRHLAGAIRSAMDQHYQALPPAVPLL